MLPTQTAPITATALTDQSDADLTATISDAHSLLTHHKARFIMALTEFHHRGLATGHGAPNTSVWIQRTHGVSRRTSYEYLGVGTKLRTFPLLSEAFLAADFSYSVVRLLLRYMTQENQEELIALARAHPFPELKMMLAGRDAPGSAPTLNKLSVVVDPETGELRLWGRLDPERGAEFMAALKISELANLVDLEGVDKQTLEDPEAVAELVDKARGAEGTEPDQGTGPRTRFGAPLASTVFTAFMGLIHIARSHPVSRVRAPGAEVNVMVTQDGRAFIPGHHGGQTGHLMRAILNGAVRYHLLDRTGLTLKVTRSTRLATAAQVKALLTAWGHQCAGPGCDHTRFLEFHHIVPWAEGGMTELSNLIPLCSGCHALVSAGIMVILFDTDPRLLRFRLPGGESYTSENRGLAVTDAAMGRWGDRYFSGPVPRGDEHLVDVWEHTDSFNDDDDGTAL
ncbi:HNH endonuclease [Corynebacterium sp.]|uniref:HNH endonuclease n=1 Tax=Corynebacterium sp. TaxID=1720 RepID=UPI0019CD8210|nr:HNH endonuclease [Corynebacterium sp.]HHU67617.1 HNH endonuclease [Corynebacterium sp.]